MCSGEGILVQHGGAFVCGHEPWCACGLLPGNDGSGLVLLRGEGAAVALGTFVAVVPDRPPRVRVFLEVPDGLGLDQGVVG